MLKRVVSVFLVFIWLLIIFSFSNTVGVSSSTQVKSLLNYIVSRTTELVYTLGFTSEPLSEQDIQMIVKNNYMFFRKICHFFVYFMLGIFAYLSVLVIFDKGILFSLLTTVGFSFVYSIIDEIHQSTIQGRNGAFTDCLIDTFGALIASALISLILYLRNNRIKKGPTE